MRIRTLVVLASALLTGCGGDDEPAPAPSEFQPFDDEVEAYLADNGLAGATAVILTDEGIVHMRGYGSFDVSRVSLIASSSKMVSAGILHKLADDGLLDLDAPIADYLGDWGDFKADITTAQLLSNSAGMPGVVEDPLYGPYICQFLSTGSLAECAESIFTADDEMDRVPPDTQFRYGGAQWQLAGGVAEVVSGKTWSQLFEETYATPCGLESSGYANHFFKASTEGGVDSAYAYPSFFTGDVSELDPTDNPNIEGGMYTTIGDYAELLLMQLRGGMCGDTRVLSEEAVTTMQSDRIAEVYDGTTDLDPTMPGYGMGWWIARSTAVISDGGAYGATPWIDLDRRYAVMFLIEGEAAQGALFRIQATPMIEELIDSR